MGQLVDPPPEGVGAKGHNKIRSRIKGDSDEEEFDDDFMFDPIIITLSSEIRVPKKSADGNGEYNSL